MKSLSEIAERFDRLDAGSKTFFRPQYVKEVFHISTGTAVFWLEVAERFGYLQPQYNLTCPSCGRIVETFAYRFEIPQTFECNATEDCREFHVTDSLIEKVYVRSQP